MVQKTRCDYYVAMKEQSWFRRLDVTIVLLTRCNRGSEEYYYVFVYSYKFPLTERSELQFTWELII